MKKIETILGCLDLTEIDPVVMRLASFMAESFQAGTLLFLHAVQAYDLPDRANKNFPDQVTIKSAIKEKLTQQICDYCAEDLDARVEVVVEEEDSANAVFEYVSSHQVDLSLIGQKYGLDREARYARKIAQGIDSDFILVSEEDQSDITAILCALDCSEESKTSFERARELSLRINARLICYYLEDITRSYFPSSASQHIRSRENKARKNYAAFLEPFGLTPEDIPCYFEAAARIDEQEGQPVENMSRSVQAVAESEKSGLIVVGARGEVSSPTTLLGNISENFLRMEKTRPVMIIKNKKSKRFFRY